MTPSILPRIASIALALSVSGATVAAAPGEVPRLTRQQRAACARMPVDFGRESTQIELRRAVIGSDGKTRIERTMVEGEVSTFYQGKVHLTQFDLGDPTKVTIVYGHPNIEIPPHPAPYRELFLILSGSALMQLPDGTSHTLTAGTMFMSEDIGGPPRGGSAGPCGYVAVSVQFKPIVR